MAVEIGPVISSRIFRGVRIELVGLGDGYTGSLSLRAGDVDLEGELLRLVGLRLSDVKLYVDATGLTEGVYELPVQCSVAGDNTGNWTGTVTPAAVTLTVEAK